MFQGIRQEQTTPDPLAATTGELLLRQWPFVLSRRQACDAYIGYANNQLTKMMRQEAVNTAQTWKFATTYLRVLLEGIELQQTGSYSLEVTGSWLSQLQAARAGQLSRGEIIDDAIKLQEHLYAAERESVLPDAPDLEAVNHFLLQTRRRFWDWEVPT